MITIPKLNIQLADIPSSLRNRVKHYNRLMKEIESYLLKHPEEWGRFQSEFNQEINGVFRDIMNFDKEHTIAKKEEKVYKLKRLFVNKICRYFLRGDYVVWSLNKPFGYAGDYQIIDWIYQNNPKTTGFDRLYDNYFQMSAISVAVRNRKEDFKRILSDLITRNHHNEIKVMDLASGPCRDLHELLSNSSKNGFFEKVSFDCYDHDNRAIGFAKKLLRDVPRIDFTRLNIIRIALNKNIEKDFPFRYDIIFSTGLFDYLDARISVRLIGNLKKLLKPGGILAISDVRDKFSNPSIYYMEWVADWSLTYREDDDFRRLFLESGFRKDSLSIAYEQQGIMQYVIARK